MRTPYSIRINELRTLIKKYELVFATVKPFIKYLEDHGETEKVTEANVLLTEGEHKVADIRQEIRSLELLHEGAVLLGEGFGPSFRRSDRPIIDPNEGPIIY